jgi:hypothetical protein
MKGPHLLPIHRTDPDAPSNVDRAGGGPALARPEPTSSPEKVVPLASGRAIEIIEGTSEDHLRVRSPEGNIVLSVRLTPDGPVLSMSGLSLEISASRALTLSGESLRLKAARDVSIEVGGSLCERVEGDAIREAAGSSSIVGQEITLKAVTGGMVLSANDDVAITGERVRLNSDDPPMPLTWEEHRARRTIERVAQGSSEEAASALLLARLPDGPER